MTHQELCDRAVGWLRGTRRCKPVLTRIASCEEVPDAIGWSSSYSWAGSTVVEVKTSKADFYADKKKYVRYRHNGFLQRRVRGEVPAGWVKEVIPSMGDYRFFLCEPFVIDEKMIESRPDHGLLYCVGRRIRVVKPAPERLATNHPAEVRYLRFAILHMEKNLLAKGFTVDLDRMTKWGGFRDGLVMSEAVLNGREV